MDIEKLTIEELKQGYALNDKEAYACNYCEKTFSAGRIYSLGEELLDAKHAIMRHISEAHGGRFEALIETESPYKKLTENQNELLRRFASGQSDDEISGQMNVAVSTVRHQRFTFRERAKQAKFCLAMHELAFENRKEEDIMPLPNNVQYIDDRFEITEEEREKLTRQLFSSLEPLKLKTFPPKAKKKVVILAAIAEKFERGRKYTEKEVNAIIKGIYEDYVTIRRFLIMYGHLDRTRDGSEYWKT